MTNIYLIRHAQAEGNLFRRMHGQNDSMITPRGMQQIQALYQRFLHIPIDACYSSDLLRARTTAQAVCLPNGLRAVLEPAFREASLGEWEDREFGELFTRMPREMDRFINDPVHCTVPGGESFTEYTDRFLNAMTEAAEHHDDQNIAIISHAAVMRGVMLRLFPEAGQKRCDNTGVSHLIYENGRFELISLYDNSHLLSDGTCGGMGRNQRTGEHRHMDLWFRPGFTEIHGLGGDPETLAYTVMSGYSAVGQLCLSEADLKTGCLRYMGLLPMFRGKRLSVQLLGKAVSVFRTMGKDNMTMTLPENGVLKYLCETMKLKAKEDNQVVMDLKLQMIPLVVPAEEN